MATKFDVTIGETDYTLEFNRSAFVKMEQMGFVMTDVASQPLSSTYLLFWGALLKHSPSISYDESVEMFDALIDDEGYTIDDILSSLIGMMNEVFTSSRPTSKSKKIKLIKS